MKQVARVHVLMSPEELAVVDAAVRSQGRSRFMALAALLALTPVGGDAWRGLYDRVRELLK